MVLALSLVVGAQLCANHTPVLMVHQVHREPNKQHRGKSVEKFERSSTRSKARQLAPSWPAYLLCKNNRVHIATYIWDYVCMSGTWTWCLGHKCRPGGPTCLRNTAPLQVMEVSNPFIFCFYGFIQICSGLIKTKIWMKHLERDGIFPCFQMRLSFISYASTFVPLDLYDKVTWSFTYWPSWYNDMWDILGPN